MPSRGYYNTSWPECHHLFLNTHVFLLKSTCALIFVTGLAGILLNLFLVYSIIRTFMPQNANLRILLVNSAVASIGLSGSLVFLSLKALISWDSDCMVDFSWFTCVISNISKVTCWSCIIVSSLGLVVDRVVAAKRLDKYKSHSKSLGIVFSSLGWIVPSSIWGLTYGLSCHKSPTRYCGNLIFIANLLESLSIFILEITLSLLILIGYAAILLISWNQQQISSINRAQFNSASRLLVRREFEATRTVMMSIQLQFLIALLFDGSLIFCFHFRFNNEFDKFVYSYLSDGSLALFTVLHPLICCRKSDGFLTNLRNIWTVCGHQPPTLLDSAFVAVNPEIPTSNLEDIEQLEKQEMEDFDELESNTFDDGND